MREKYVDIHAGVWFIFGERHDGTVDVADQLRDIFTGLPRDVAEKVVAAQDKFREELYQILQDA